MGYTSYDDIILYQDDTYCLWEDDFWIWDKTADKWKALDAIPEFLTIINDRLALVNEEGQHFCNCRILALWNLGCRCGGL